MFIGFYLKLIFNAFCKYFLIIFFDNFRMHGRRCVSH
jgi:hypothetical protein